MHKELKRMYDLDLADHAKHRVFGTAEYDEMRQRDADRRSRVRSVLNEQEDLEPIDLFHATWILNHGDNVPDASLAVKVAEESMNGGYEQAKWLYVAAFDRLCMYRGLPQKFGTQIVPDGIAYRVWDTCSETTDEERQAHNVPPIAEMHARATKDSDNLPQPPMEFAPKWLAEAIERWNLGPSPDGLLVAVLCVRVLLTTQ